MSANTFIVCLDCGHQEESFSAAHPECPSCGSLWREAHYDYAELGITLPALLIDRPFNLWRYHELLPLASMHDEISLGEGGTPLIHAANLGLMLGCPKIYVKDERQGPTASFKDRQASVTIAALKEAGIDEFVIASTGNVAISYSAYSVRAGVKLWAFLTSLVPSAKMREVAIYGTQVIKITGSYDQAKQVANQFAQSRKLKIDQGARTLPCIESMKTIGFEIAEQLGRLQKPDPAGDSNSKIKWDVPDWYIQAVSGGMGPIGVLKSFSELKEMGMIDHLPKIAVIQPEGCAPMVNAWKQGQETANPIQSPHTLISTLSTGDPGRSYTLLRQKMLAAAGGVFETVTDNEAYRAMHLLAKLEGLSVESATGVAFAGLIKLIRSGEIKPNETVVINCTGHTMPVERSILGEGWSRDINLPLQSMEESNEEGLLAALSKVAVDRYPRIAIADDNPDVLRLIRRILQSQGKYTLYEATNGRDAIDLVRKELPNLLILDLMMPEMDGFAVINELEKSPETAEIPIIVVTAKELTPAEKERLLGHIQTLMQKGDFLSDELLDEVRALLG